MYDPQRFLELEQEFGVQPGYLKTLYGIETGYGKNLGPSSAGALGHFQFMPGTLEHLRQQGHYIDPMDLYSSARGALVLAKMNAKALGTNDPVKLALAHHSGAKNVMTGNIGPAGRQYERDAREGLGMNDYGQQPPTMPPAAGQEAILRMLAAQQQPAMPPAALPQESGYFDQLMTSPAFMGGFGILATPTGTGSSLTGMARGLLGGWGQMQQAQDRMTLNDMRRAQLQNKIHTDQQRDQARQKLALMEAMGITPPPTLIALAYPEAASTLFKTPDMPSSYREWQMYKQHGGPMDYPGFFDRYGRQGQVSVNIADKAEDMAMGKALGEHAAGVITGAGKEEDQLNLVKQAQNSLDEVLAGGGTTGPVTPPLTWAASLAQQFGLDPGKLGLPRNPSHVQVLDSVLKQMTLGKIGGEGGMPSNNFSDADRRFIEASTGSISDTPEALKKKLNIVRVARERSAFRARFFQERAMAGMNAPQILGEWNRYVQSHPLVVRSNEDYRRLSPGDYFISPDGRIGQKSDAQ